MGKVDSIDPGKSAALTVSVEESKYVLICNMFAGGTSHYLSGMYNDFDISPTAPGPETATPTPVP